MIGVSSKNNLKSTQSYLERMKARQLFRTLEQHGRMGVLALERATPRDSGLTAGSWGYRVIRDHRWPGIEWFNTNEMPDGTSIAILVQYGHGTGTGGYVQGRDFINPAMRPVFDQIVRELREKVNS